MTTTEKVIVVVPWHNAEQLQKFVSAWDLTEKDKELFQFQQDKDRSGCAVTKNRGVRAAVERGADIVIVLDDDCFPLPEDSRRAKNPFGSPTSPIHDFIRAHVVKLNSPVPRELFKHVTVPSSRGSPYLASSSVQSPIAAVMGFWVNVGDYDAVGQLSHGPTNPMIFNKTPIFGQYFPLCGMNLCFRPKEWQPWCNFINVSRFDDIWQGWLWQKEAYRRGYSFRLDGPEVFHSRQSNVWANLRDEALYLEDNDTLWREIALHPSNDYATLRATLPVQGLDAP